MSEEEERCCRVASTISALVVGFLVIGAVGAGIVGLIRAANEVPCPRCSVRLAKGQLQEHIRNVHDYHCPGCGEQVRMVQVRYYACPHCGYSEKKKGAASPLATSVPHITLHPNTIKRTQESFAETHQAKGVGNPETIVAEASSSPSPAASASSAPEFKLCPDCAEQIRFPARKCRFCGYEFADAPV